MSVTGYMYNINATKKLGELELSEGYEGHHSWHNQFKGSAYIYVGGLHTGMTEGDAIILFSQFGEVVDINLIRDKTTGKSKGFAFICFEDQRSTILAVDNMNGFQLLGRTIRVDHVEKYKAPKKLSETEKDEDGDPTLLEYEATGAEGKGYKVYNVLDTQKKIDEISRQKKKAPGPKKPEDEDEAWAKSFEESLKSMDAMEAICNVKRKKTKKDLKKEKEDLKKVLEETKRLKKEAKLAKEAKRKKKAKLIKQDRADARQNTKVKKQVKSEDSSSSSSSSSSSGSSSSEDSGKKAKKRKK